MKVYYLACQTLLYFDSAYPDSNNSSYEVMILEDRVDVNGTCGVPDCGVHAGSRVTNHMADGKVAGKEAGQTRCKL